MKLNKMREQMANAFIDALKQDEIPWRKCWSSTSMFPINATTHTPYRSGNALWLAVNMQVKGFKDPRWCTFKQASDKGWKIKKESKGVPIEFWSLYDKQDKKIITSKEAEAIKANTENWQERIRPMAKTYIVFNAEQIEGIPELKVERHELKLENFLEKRDVLLKNMSVGLSEGHEGASYSPKRDTIQMPNVENFKDEYAYISTFLHEAGHATGHESRLNRPILNSFGSPDYAKEELRAEIASAFTSQTLGVVQTNNEHLDNHKAYVQNWISVLENNPEELFAAIKDAEKISDYLIAKGEIEACYQIIDEPEQEQRQEELTQSIKKENKTEPKKAVPHKFYTKEESAQMVEWLKSNIKVEDVCKSFGYTPLKVGSVYYTLKEHDSVRINTDKNCFFWNSAGIEGSVIDACAALGNMNVHESCNYLYEMAGGREKVYEYACGGKMPDVSEPKFINRNNKNLPEKEKENKEIKLPAKNGNYRNVYAYLTKSRMISVGVVNEFVKRDMLYQDNMNNCVFVSRDKEGKPVFACKRGTNTNRRFIGDVEGCNYNKGFYIDNAADKLIVTESVIDAMSRMTLMEQAGADYHQFNYLAMSGTEKQESILNVLKENQNIKEVELSLDNDAGGILATSQIEELLKDKDVVVTKNQPNHIGYDWNDVLQLDKQQSMWPQDNRTTSNEINKVKPDRAKVNELKMEL